ncbi:pYEATS domain-containing protein [Xanthomonas citri pv. bilvae]|uniref:pYEATS domain-containing protein n=3 Tax=Xanthomonas citri TaxID=346 RepID=UPI0030C88BB0
MDLIAALIWPVFIGAVLWWLRKDIPRLFGALVDRVEKRDSAEAFGVKLGSSQPKLPPDTSAAALPASSPPAKADPGAPHEIYLLHRYTRAKSLDKNGRRYYRLNIWVESDGIDLGTVNSITYHLHETFENPVRVVSDHLTAFALDTGAWGSFLLFADVSFKDGTVWRIERYLNF